MDIKDYALAVLILLSQPGRAKSRQQFSITADNDEEWRK
jgi:hypothetical protein